MADSPAPRDDAGAPLPARRMSSQQLEAVIRRAVELQSAAGGADDGVAEAEVVRIGQELGLEPAHVRRAITEMRSNPPAEGGFMAALMGPGLVRVGRTIRRPAAELGRFLEAYMTQVECMQVHRRFPDRTRYLRDGSFAAGLERFARQFGTRAPRLEMKEIDISVSRVDDETAYVELSIDIGGDRAGYLAGGSAIGTVLSIPAVSFALVTPAPDLIALAAVPLFGAMIAAFRAAYRQSAQQTRDKFESFLDRLEHGEVRLPAESSWSDAVKRIKPPRL